ncbi:hypothetical protein BREVUG8_10143 [Brevundimonas sp. G8]|nr:hypothetical protein BREVUG8_10143 [Brevundimonas sp. G8]
MPAGTPKARVPALCVFRFAGADRGLFGRHALSLDDTRARGWSPVHKKARGASVERHTPPSEVEISFECLRSTN